MRGYRTAKSAVAAGLALGLLVVPLGDASHIPAVMLLAALIVGVATFTIGRIVAVRPRRDERRIEPHTDAVRRRLIVAGSAAVAAVAAVTPIGRLIQAATSPSARAVAAEIHPEVHVTDSMPHLGGGTIGEVDHARNGFDPTAILDDWDVGSVSTLPNGQTLRDYLIIAEDRSIEVAPGVFFEAWTYNGRVPGPTIRAREGDRVRVEFINGGSHPHTIHFHGIHPASMDGVPGQGAGNIAPGASTVYEFDAFPFGCHLYHCHTSPLKRHIHKGLYGAFLIDPDPARHPDQRALAERRTVDGARAAGIRELLIVMNGFDTNFDGENEIYAANTVAFHYATHPIRIGTDDDVRLYLVNVTEFDPLNSLHLHANFFDYYDHGTTLEPTSRTIDTVAQIQAQRGILEFSYRGYEPGQYMFHAHQSEFVELGWMSLFDVVPGRTT